MRQQSASSVCAALLAATTGCSLIYNPSNLPDNTGDGGVDSPIDAEIIEDANPAALTLTRVYPPVLLEGTGAGNSRKAVLVVYGQHIVDDAMVSVTAHAGEAGTPKITVDNSSPDRVAENKRSIAVPITLDVDDQLAENATIRLDVTVTQATPGGPKTVTLEQDTGGGPTLLIKGLPELVASGVQELSGDKDYSIVNVTGGGINNVSSAPLRIRSTSTVLVMGNVTSNATTATGVGGGGNGGGGGPAGGGAGGPGTGPSPGTPNGGGGGHMMKGGGATGGAAVGNDQFTEQFPGSGGAGGNGVLLVGSGGAGGGGGGLIEISSNGNLTVAGNVEAKGANGAVGAADDGGGGSGGSVLLRAFGTLSVTSVAVNGGMTGQNAGSPGRYRFDAAGGNSTGGYRGVMWVEATPLVTRQERPTLTVTGKAGIGFTYYIENEDRSSLRGPFTGAVAQGGQNSFQLAEPLFQGTNHVCVLVEGATIAAMKPEARNCIELVYLLRVAQ